MPGTPRTRWPSVNLRHYLGRYRTLLDTLPLPLEGLQVVLQNKQRTEKPPRGTRKQNLRYVMTTKGGLKSGGRRQTIARGDDYGNLRKAVYELARLRYDLRKGHMSEKQYYQSTRP